MERMTLALTFGLAFGRAVVCSRNPIGIKVGAAEPGIWRPNLQHIFDRELWYTANRSAGITMAITGIAIAVAALVVPRLMPDYSEGARVLVIGGIAIFAVVIMVVRLVWQVLRL